MQPGDFFLLLEQIDKIIPHLIGWLITYGIHSSLLLGTVWVLSRFFSQNNPKVQDILWKFAIVGGLLSASFQYTNYWEPIGGKYELTQGEMFDHDLFTESDDVSPIQSKISQKSHFSTFPSSSNISSEKVANTSSTSGFSYQIIKKGQCEDSLDIAVMEAMVFSGTGNHLVDFENTAGKKRVFSQFVDANNISIETDVLFDDSQIGNIDSGETLIENIEGLHEIASGLKGNYSFKMGWMHWLALIWFFGSSFFMMRYFWQRYRLKLLLANRVQLTDPLLYGLLQKLQIHTNKTRKLVLSVSANITSPMVISRKEICIPQRALETLSSAEKETMLAHELAHINRHDPIWLHFFAIIEILCFFQPLNHFSRHRVQEAAEFLCDDWAVRFTGKNLNLAKCLARVAEWMQPLPEYRYLAAMNGNGSVLKRRVLRILAEPERKESITKWQLGGVITILCIVMLSAPFFSAKILQNKIFMMVLDKNEVFTNAENHFENKKLWITTSDSTSKMQHKVLIKNIDGKMVKEYSYSVQFESEEEI